MSGSCNWCPKNFDTQVQLSKHEKIRHNERSIYPIEIRALEGMSSSPVVEKENKIEDEDDERKWKGPSLVARVGEYEKFIMSEIELMKDRNRQHDHHHQYEYQDISMRKKDGLDGRLNGLRSRLTALEEQLGSLLNSKSGKGRVGCDKSGPTTFLKAKSKERMQNDVELEFADRIIRGKKDNKSREDNLLRSDVIEKLNDPQNEPSKVRLAAEFGASQARLSNEATKKEEIACSCLVGLKEFVDEDKGSVRRHYCSCSSSSSCCCCCCCFAKLVIKGSTSSSSAGVSSDGEQSKCTDWPTFCQLIKSITTRQTILAERLTTSDSDVEMKEKIVDAARDQKMLHKMGAGVSGLQKLENKAEEFEERVVADCVSKGDGQELMELQAVGSCKLAATYTIQLNSPRDSEEFEVNCWPKAVTFKILPGSSCAFASTREVVEAAEKEYKRLRSSQEEVAAIGSPSTTNNEASSISETHKELKRDEDEEDAVLIPIPLSSLPLPPPPPSTTSTSSSTPADVALISCSEVNKKEQEFCKAELNSRHESNRKFIGQPDSCKMLSFSADGCAGSVHSDKSDLALELQATSSLETSPLLTAKLQAYSLNSVKQESELLADLQLTSKVENDETKGEKVEINSALGGASYSNDKIKSKGSLNLEASEAIEGEDNDNLFERSNSGGFSYSLSPSCISTASATLVTSAKNDGDSDGDYDNNKQRRSSTILVRQPLEDRGEVHAANHEQESERDLKHEQEEELLKVGEKEGNSTLTQLTRSSNDDSNAPNFHNNNNNNNFHNNKASKSLLESDGSKQSDKQGSIVGRHPMLAGKAPARRGSPSIEHKSCSVESPLKASFTKEKKLEFSSRPEGPLNRLGSSLIDSRQPEDPSSLTSTIFAASTDMSQQAATEQPARFGSAGVSAAAATDTLELSERTETDRVAVEGTTAGSCDGAKSELVEAKAKVIVKLAGSLKEATAEGATLESICFGKPNNEGEERDIGGEKGSGTGEQMARVFRGITESLCDRSSEKEGARISSPASTTTNTMKLQDSCQLDGSNDLEREKEKEKKSLVLALALDLDSDAEVNPLACSSQQQSGVCKAKSWNDGANDNEMVDADKDRSFSSSSTLAVCIKGGSSFDAALGVERAPNYNNNDEDEAPMAATNKSDEATKEEEDKKKKKKKKKSLALAAEGPREPNETEGNQPAGKHEHLKQEIPAQDKIRPLKSILKTRGKNPSLRSIQNSQNSFGRSLITRPVEAQNSEEHSSYFSYASSESSSLGLSIGNQRSGDNSTGRRRSLVRFSDDLLSQADRKR